MRENKPFTKRRREVTGASAAEYGVLVALIVAVIAVAVFALTGLVQSATSTTCKHSTGDSSVAGGSCAP